MTNCIPHRCIYNTKGVKYMNMYYLIVTIYPCGYEETVTVNGTKELEWCTDGRILSIHHDATYIAKVYKGSLTVPMKGYE